jgi:hypothetical protein
LFQIKLRPLPSKVFTYYALISLPFDAMQAKTPTVSLNGPLIRAINTYMPTATRVRNKILGLLIDRFYRDLVCVNNEINYTISQ